MVGRLLLLSCNLLHGMPDVPVYYVLLSILWDEVMNCTGKSRRRDVEMNYSFDICCGQLNMSFKNSSHQANK